LRNFFGGKDNVDGNKASSGYFLPAAYSAASLDSAASFANRSALNRSVFSATARRCSSYSARAFAPCRACSSLCLKLARASFDFAIIRPYAQRKHPSLLNVDKDKSPHFNGLGSIGAGDRDGYVASGVPNDPTTISVDGVKALAFHGFDDGLGDTYEVWFIKDGFLYEVLTYKELERELNLILATWRFI
jgi:hypothetical protein